MYTASSRDHQYHPYASTAPMHSNGSVSLPPNHHMPSSNQSSGGQMVPSTLQPPPQLPGPGQMSEGFSSRSEGRTYKLVVGQQPVRARMCGFGDKDRRPITPPPCARLIVLDSETGKEIDINEIDMNHFVLTVDLWSADGTREVNLVRHSATSPSISAAVSSSYPPPPPTPPPPHPLAPSQQSGYSPQGMYPPQSYSPQVYSPYGQHPPPMPPQHGYYPPPGGYPPSNGYPLPPPSSQMPPQGPNMPPQSQQPPPSGMFTRNLIGSLTASAFRLTDPDNKIGIWFVLQDLSVRTEGTFRLKMNFVNVGINGRLNTTGAPVPILASVFSAPFQVFSAKKFPGVIESTELSKCFATQGMKIPIRKDGPKALSRGQDDDDDY
ncbi:hypothetical protein TWF694_011064 [Orbilia ellipsospora]|uniref:Velvet domain-containing protein n=1 Tax=Orbilia ellipsospora TaxID=2528407 RepID=A0AAV9X925_9PEZI